MCVESGHRKWAQTETVDYSAIEKPRWSMTRYNNNYTISLEFTDECILVFEII